MKSLLRLVAVFVLLALLVGVLPIVSASGPVSIGTPTLRARATSNPNVTQIYADGITDGGVPGHGSAAFVVWFYTPPNVGLSDISVTAGPAWIAQNCNFTVSLVVPQAATVANTYQLDGFCTTTATGPRVTGSNILVATVTFSANACAANPGGFLFDITDEQENTCLVEPDGTPYIIPADGLTDGGACGNPTAVTLSNVSASPITPIGNSLYLAAAGSIALLGAAGLALRGTRKH